MKAYGTNWDWLEKHLVALIQKTSTISKIEPDVFYPTGPWSALKLITLLLYVELFSKIAFSQKTQKFFKNVIYIDLLAGSGLNGINGNMIAGSPVIANEFSTSPFTGMFLCENKPEYKSALNKRLSKLGTKFKIYEDCNSSIENIIKDFPRNPLCLTFIDNEGLDVSWETVSRIARHKGDVIINYPTALIPRVSGKTDTSKADEDKMNFFFGDDGWKGKSKQELLEYYEEKLKSIGNKIIENINVSSEKQGGFHYHLIFALGITAGGNPWLPALYPIKKKVEHNSGKVISMALDILSGKSKNIKSFIE